MKCGSRCCRLGIMYFSSSLSFRSLSTLARYYARVGLGYRLHFHLYSGASYVRAIHIQNSRSTTPQKRQKWRTQTSSSCQDPAPKCNILSRIFSSSHLSHALEFATSINSCPSPSKRTSSNTRNGIRRSFRG